ncbi:MAG: SBBP repeat-containing protein, partial [Verrucomicrobia bacterium]|nr:SBBP repeat-containing protein [Verrucomicrobiota bacterium]
AVAVDGSGNVVVTGRSWNGTDYEIYTAKYAAADGALLWEQRYNGAANRDDYANAVAVDGSGNVVVTGNSNWDFYTAKYAAADGALLWERRYTGPENSYDYANAVAVDGSGNVVVTGPPDRNYYTAKYAAADGALLWERRYNGPENSYDYANAVAVDRSGNVVVTGYSNSDFYTAKYAAADGALLWEQRYNSPGNGDYANAVAVDGNGNVVVTGYSWNDGTGYDCYTAKYAAADGALLWEQRYNGPANNSDEARAVTVDGSGNVVVTGVSNAWRSDDVYGGDYYTAKYAAADGALLWEQTYNGSAPTEASARAVAVDGSGNVVVTGYSGSQFDSLGYTNPDYYTAKYAAADGALPWEKRYNGPENGGGQANAIALDGSGNVVVTGTSNGDYYTAKYAAVNGALLWEKRYNGPGHDHATAVAVDGSGNVVVTGRSLNGTRYDYYTAKYAAADGALLWARRYNGQANRDDSAHALAVDGSGNVVVTGNSDSGLDSFGNTISDCYTAKYAAADGALLWEKRFIGPASVGYSPPRLALGADGMVIVTGTDKDGYATVAYREVPAVSIDLISTGVRLRFTGVPGRSYNVERAPAVIGPWSTINTQTAPASGLLEYLDTHSPAAAAFYRTHEP